MYDPLEKAEEDAKLVCQGHHRKYYRFRAARFYGGIAAADCVGCCLRFEGVAPKHKTHVAWSRRCPWADA
jgi:uncharacterized Fe-S cluster-containing radical SAM superfamily protein